MRGSSVLKPCAVCGGIFKAIPANLARGWDRFCGNPCRYASKVISVNERLARLVDRSGGPEVCWPWRGTRNSQGYGVLSVNGRQQKAHRIAWEIANGRSVPDGFLIRHLCAGGGNPWCVNPAHLGIGTERENAADKVRWNRQCAGATNGRARLSTDDVAAIRMRHAAGEAGRALAREFGVVHSTVQKIVRGRLWKMSNERTPRWR